MVNQISEPPPEPTLEPARKPEAPQAQRRPRLPGPGPLLQKAWKQSLRWLYPHRCLLCLGPGQKDMDLCRDCQQELPLMGNACRSCSLPLPAGQEQCGECLRRPSPFAYCLSACHYRTPVTTMISRFKYQGRRPHGRALAQLLAIEVRRHYRQRPLPQLLVPVPLATHRLRRRGFNQALEISRTVARQLGMDHCGHSFRRRPGPPQVGMDAAARRTNVRKVFAVRRQLWPETVAILDDVMTTGATAEALGQALKQAGCKEVHAWFVARAQLGEGRR